MHAQISLDDYQAYTMRVADTCGVSTNGEAAEVIVWRATMHRLATVSNDSLHVQSR